MMESLRSVEGREGGGGGNGSMAAILNYTADGKLLPSGD